VNKLNPIEIRPTVATDLPRLMGMDHTCSTEYVWQVDLRREPGQFFVSLREVRLPRAVQVSYPRNPFALADEWQYKTLMLTAAGPEPLAYICVNTQSAGEVAWVTDLAVSPDHRKLGVGLALLRQAEAWAMEQRSRMMFFETTAKNHPAIRLAQKFGLEFCGYNDHYYSNRDVALFFGRSLE
jgi:ribosomal protein S18 acetylase RimI-like enzyme